MGRIAKAEERDASPVLVERDAELGAIADAIARGQGGEGSLVLIEGPAGIGKTALLGSGVGDRLGPADHLMSASADELESGLPFGVVEQLVGDVIVPAESEGPSGDEARMRTIHLTFRRIEELASVQATVIAVDDLHWADRSSLRFLNYIARRLSELPIVLIATRRTTDDTDPRTTLLLDRLREGSTHILELPPLTERGVEAILRDALGECAEGLVSACARESAGNPLLLQWLIDRVVQLAENGQVPSGEQITEIASTDANALLSRLIRLGPEAEGVARLIAVLNVDATLERVAHAAEMNRSAAGAVIAGLQRAGILDGGERLRFVHPLVKSAVHHAMSHGERAGMAHRAAKALYETGGRVDRVAARLTEAGGSDELWTRDVLGAAATTASAAGAPRVAASYLRMATAVPQPASTRIELSLRLAQAEAITGVPDYLDRYELALAELGDPLARARSLSELAGIRGTRGELREALDLVLRAVGELDGGNPAFEAQLVAQAGTLLLFGGGGPEAAIELVTRHAGHVIAKRAEDPNEPERMLLAQAAARLALASAIDRQGCLALLRPLTNPTAPMIHQAAIAPLAIAVSVCDELAVAERLLERSIADAGCRGAIGEHLQMVSAQTQVKLRAGDPSGGLQGFREALARAQEVGARAPIHPIGGILAALEAEGVEAAESYLPADDPERWEGTLLGCELRVVRGRLAAQRGDAETALELLVAGGEELERKGVTNVNYQEWRGTAAIAASALGQSDRAEELSSANLELAQSFGSPRGIGFALRCQGLVEGGERGLELLSASVAVLEGSPAKLARTTSLLELGSALRRAHRGGDAERRLTEAVNLAEACRARPLVERGLAELATLGRRRPRRALTGIDALTPAELRTARMARGGMTNKEIASSLFLALRTIESHLTSTYRKLGIGSRAELGDALGEDEPALA